MEDTLIIILLLVTGLCIWLYIKFKKERKLRDTISRENTKLIADNALLLNEHLKFQLQPHTLNNILANLKLFSNKLNKGLDSLSATLEYILYRGNHHLVSVQDELYFIKKYLELNDLFNNEIDSIILDDKQVNTSSKFFTSTCLPHLITAYLVENAFKHGDTHHPQFLRVIMILNENYFAIRVVNKIKSKPVKGNGGIGLKNMTERLDLLLPGKYELGNSTKEQEYHSHLIIRF